MVPLTGAAVAAPFVDYEAFLAAAPPGFEYAPHEEDDPVSMCYTSGTTGRPKGVVYSHRSTVIHTLMANQPDHWCLSAKDCGAARRRRCSTPTAGACRTSAR